MFAVVGPQSGRIKGQVINPWGRFAWTKMRGTRDEVILESRHIVLVRRKDCPQDFSLPIHIRQTTWPEKEF